MTGEHDFCHLRHRGVPTAHQGRFRGRRKAECVLNCLRPARRHSTLGERGRASARKLGAMRAFSRSRFKAWRRTWQRLLLLLLAAPGGCYAGGGSGNPCTGIGPANCHVIARAERQDAAWAREGWSRACYRAFGEPPWGPALGAWLSPSRVACDERYEPEACVTMAKAYAYGCRVEPNRAFALWLLRSSCASGELAGCYAYASVSQEPEDLLYYGPAIRRLLRERCDAGEWPECVRLAHIMWNGYWGEPPSREAATVILIPPCDAGDAESCREFAGYAAQSQVAEHAKRARRINEEWCSKGDIQFGWACDGVLTDAAHFKARGQDAAEKRSLEIACNGGMKSACRALDSLGHTVGNEPEAP